MPFDSLTFARQLKAAGFTETQAEALADANRELLMPDLATKGDIAEVKGEITAVKSEIAAVKSEIASIRADMATKGDIASVRVEISAMEQRRQASMEALGLRLTVRLGVMMAAGIAILSAILHLR